jgi:hypothetical protein
VLFGDRTGTVTDDSGWFRFEPAASAFPLDLRIQRIGWDVVTLHLTGEAQTVRFFMQPIHISVGGCGSIRPAEQPVPPPNEVRLRLMNARTNEPVSASVHIELHRVGGEMAGGQSRTGAEGDLRLPIQRHGVYDVTLKIPGFRLWRTPSLAVGFDECDPDGVKAVHTTVWLIPTE